MKCHFDGTVKNFHKIQGSTDQNWPELNHSRTNLGSVPGWKNSNLWQDQVYNRPSILDLNWLADPRAQRSVDPW